MPSDDEEVAAAAKKKQGPTVTPVMPPSSPKAAPAVDKAAGSSSVGEGPRAPRPSMQSQKKAKPVHTAGDKWKTHGETYRQTNLRMVAAHWATSMAEEFGDFYTWANKKVADSDWGRKHPGAAKLLKPFVALGALGMPLGAIQALGSAKPDSWRHVPWIRDHAAPVSDGNGQQAEGQRAPSSQEKQAELPLEEKEKALDEADAELGKLGDESQLKRHADDTSALYHSEAAAETPAPPGTAGPRR